MAEASFKIAHVLYQLIVVQTLRYTWVRIYYQMVQVIPRFRFSDKVQLYWNPVRVTSS